MDIEKLAGRELDGAVAIAVMGWKTAHGTRQDIKTGGTIHHVQVENPMGFWWELEIPEKQAALTRPSWWCDQVGVPHYSADPELAQQVVAVAKARGAEIREPKVLVPKRTLAALLCRQALKAVVSEN